MKYGKNLWIIIALFLVQLILSGCSSPYYQHDSQLEDAYIDLSQISLSDKILRLDGEWKFVNCQLLNPSSPEWDDKDLSTVKIPGIWDNYIIKNTRLSNKGYCTMQITVKLAKPFIRLGIKIYQISTAYNLFINDKLIADSGRVAANSEHAKPSYKPVTEYFLPETEEIRITLQISNYHGRLGGAWTPIVFGDAKKISLLNYLDTGLDMAIIGILLIIGIYHIIIWFSGFKNKGALLFALGCLSLCIRTMTAGEIFFMTIFSNFDFELNYKFMFISQAAAVLFLFMTARFMFSKVFHILVERIVLVLIILYSIFIALTPLVIHNQTLIFFQIFLCVVAAYFLFVIILSIKTQQIGAKTIAVGALIFFISITNDILFSNSIIHTTYFVPFGLIIFSFSFILVLSRISKKTIIVQLPEIDIMQLKKKNISKREHEVLDYLLKGLSYDDIAATLFISKSTVTKHIHSIYGKLEVRNRVNLYDAVQHMRLNQNKIQIN